MKTYLVGGAVRDQLLDYPVSERDWVVVGATAAELLEQGFKPVDSVFPVYIHPQTGEEYALARTEKKTGPGYKGFEVYAGSDVTLQQDLARRDLTINAIAQDADGSLIDPFNGVADIEAGLLRHVTSAFSEDPIRLIRIARFAARFGHFRVAHSTFRLLRQMAESDEIDTVRPERFWKEMACALSEQAPWRFFEVLQSCGALQKFLPDLAVLLNHPADHSGVSGQPLQRLRRSVNKGNDAKVHFAVLLLDAVPGRKTVEDVLRKVRAGKDYIELLQWLVTAVRDYPALAQGSAGELLDFLQRYRAFRDQPRFRLLLDACQVIFPQFDGLVAARLASALKAAAAIKAVALARDDLSGPDIAAALREQRILAIDKAVTSLEKGCP